MIWTDLAPLCVFIALFEIHLRQRIAFFPPYSLAAGVHLGAILSRICSCVYHIYNCCSLRANQRLIHLDHIGIGPAVNGDTIYNGALDNALGTAVILELAERLVSGPRLRRPVLFASLTGEEKGLLGAYHLSRHLPPRVHRFAANVNLDMPVILGPSRELIALGAEHSTLGALMDAAAARTGFKVVPDPSPEEVFFVRSDQYPFVRAGVPALALKLGEKSSDPAIDLKALNADFRKNHYHKPSDDLSRPIHWPTALEFTAVATELVRTLATDATAPSWKPGDFFGTRFGPEKKKP
jgi:Zn-dependent M28 family amino/carboxypeptidase